MKPLLRLLIPTETPIQKPISRIHAIAFWIMLPVICAIFIILLSCKS